MTGLWIPGMSAGPQEELVERIHRQIERFAADAGVERAVVEIELADGSRFALDSLSPEPGFGFVTIVPHPGLDEELPERLIVPVGLIRRIELARAEEQRAQLGFSTLPG
ncbi:MAG: hypothetical protein ACRDN6_07535 [Gaiellaceae bacterium]